jgi:intracellular sulfur oxidation DsrE/DsrF family protein
MNPETRLARFAASVPPFASFILWSQAMFKHFRSIFLVTSSLLLVSAAPPALSAGQDGPEYKYVLHISDMDPSKQELILNNARNVLDAYPPGEVEVEVVAYGPGLRLMFADNANSKRLDSLAMSGVKFSACGNTLKGMTKLMGEAPKLNPSAGVVPGGIIRIGELVHQGYIYVKP